ncbi:MAG TPA: Rne/Rng family ribonuclease [Bryobacteraceae bacterium]|nr:Rne/Rng family ribonuclease [Bryobacteraceae bacterium]
MSSSKELVVSQNRHATKLGILEDGQLVEVYFQRADEYSLAGSVHKGRVTRVLPGMQSAFVDLGLERDCFLYVSDFFDEHGEDIDRVEEKGPANRGRGRERDRDRGKERDTRREPRRDVAPRPTIEAAPAVEAETGSAEQEGRVEPGDNSQDQRRRSRRRRRSGRGLPESKYAEASDAAEDSEPVGEMEAEAGDGAQLAAGEETARHGGSPSSEVIILPGESLAKYRRAAARSYQDEPLGVNAKAIEENDFEAAADDAAESILDRIEEFERGGESTIADAGDSLLDRIVEGEDAEETVEADASVLENGDESGIDLPDGEAVDEHGEEADSPSVSDVRVSVSFDIGDAVEIVEPPALAEREEDGKEGWVGLGLEVDSKSARVAGPDELPEPDQATGVESEDETSEVADTAGPEDVEGVEPARMPVSLTATLRSQGGRLGHRATRRSRRRGRGDRGGQETEMEPAGTESRLPPETEPVAETVVAAKPAEVRQPRGRDRDRDRDNGEREHQQPSISDLLKEGQEIIVQIAKEPLGQKGARITSHIALPGRYVVYMPTIEHLGVSRKISTEEERQRLKIVLQRQREGLQGGYIMRTAGEGRTEEEIGADMRYLAALWKEIKDKADKRRAPALLHHDVEIVERILRDHLTGGFKAIWVDHEELYEQVLHTVERFSPQLLSRVKLYTRQEPIFDAFGITQEMEKALRPKVWLKSGGYIVINQTEALVAIDVNTGKYVGKSNRLEDTIVKTNIEAIREIVRQMRLRDLGGIIVVDFIDMDERKNRQKVMQTLEETMRQDKAPYKILQFNDFGLVAITRKRVKQSLERALCSPCPYCEGSGYVKSPETIIGEILNQAQKYARVVDGQECVLRVNPEVAALVKSLKNNYLEELEEILGRPVMVISDAEIHQEKYDLT